MGEKKPKLTLYQPTTYQIKVPGSLDPSWQVWDEQITIMVESKVDGTPITTLTGTIDQASLQGLLRRLYVLGLPLISVICLEVA